MFYIYRVKRLVQIVVDEMADSTNPMGTQGDPTLHHCLLEFQKLNKKYTPQIAKRTLAIATGEKKYLRIDNQQGGSIIERQRLLMTDEGIKLLEADGFINALAGSVTNITSMIAVVIALFALGISIWTAAHAGGVVHVQLLK